MTIVTLTKLFATRIVAIKCFGFDKSLSTLSEDFVCLDFKILYSAGVKEKNAVSEADIIAEKNKNINRIINASIVLKLKELNTKMFIII